MIRIFTISLLLALCACTDQQTELGDASRALRFGVESIEDTKGSIINTSNITSMSVFCAHTGKEQYSSTATSNWMHNVQVTRADENSEWTVQGDGVNKQWKDDGYHSFFAFAPHAPEVAKVSLPETQGPPILTYTVPENYAEQVDLLYSHTTLINGKQMYIGSRPVVFGFRHALSKITFEAKREVNNVNDQFYVKEISLQNLNSKGVLNFNLDNQFIKIDSANWSNIDIPTSFSCRAPKYGLQDKWLTDEMALISAEETGFFVIPQNIDENSAIVITYIERINDVSTNKTLNLKLSDLLSEFQFGKAYRFSIVLKVDKVTVTAQITDWADQTVDVAVPGTYLNVAQLSLSLPQGTGGDIYYSTDGSPVKATCDNPIIQFEPQDITPTKITFPSSAPYGNYIVTVSAGKLKREVKVEVKSPPYIQIGDLLWATGNLVADGPNKCKIGQPHDGGLYFKFGSLIGWTGGLNGDGCGFPNSNISLTVNVKPLVYTGGIGWDQHNSGWPGDSLPVSGHGDPCRYYLSNGWRLPTNSEFKALFEDKVTETNWNSIPSWEKQGPFESESESYAKHKTSGLLLRANGLRINENGTLSTSNMAPGQYGAYWSSTKVGDVIYSLSFNSENVYPYNTGLDGGNAFPIRCVKPVGTTPEPEDPDFIVEDGVAAPRIFVQGTGDNAKLMLTKKPTNYGAYFQFMGITAWAHNGANNSGAAIYKPMTSNTAIGAQGWTSTNDHSLTSIRAGKGDPCRLVGYTQRQVQDMITAGTVPDNKMWKTPDTNADITGIEGWIEHNNALGIFLKTSNERVFLPAAGLAWRAGSWEQQGSQGAYWTRQSSNDSQGSPFHFQQYSGPSFNWKQHHSLKMSVRCVRQ